MKERQVTDGARLLRAYLQATGETVPDFSERAGLNRIYVQRGLSGDQKRFGLDFALAIQRAAGRDEAGAWRVPAEAWAAETAIPVDGNHEGRVHPTFRRRDEDSLTGTGG